MICPILQLMATIATTLLSSLTSGSRSSVIRLVVLLLGALLFAFLGDFSAIALEQFNTFLTFTTN
jgi:hypothetical protein